MTPQLWIAAVAVACGAAAGPAAPATAQERPLVGVTIETPETVLDKVLPITGQAAVATAATRVRVTVTPIGLPNQCGGARDATGPVGGDGRYDVEIEVRCNGRHRIEAVAEGGVPATATREVGVAEPPPPPAPPRSEHGAAGTKMVWAPATDPDAAGWILIVDGVPKALELGVLAEDVPDDGFTHIYSLVQQRWGAGGPGSEPVASPPSTNKTAVYYDDRPGGPGPVSVPEPPARADPPSAAPGPAAGPPASSSTAPATTGSRPVPTRGVGAPSATLPEGYQEDLPYGVPDDAFVPGSEPRRTPGSGDEESAAGTSPARALVRTSEEQAPGLVAPFALGLMLATVAVHIGWYLRRSRPSGPQQVKPG